MLGYQAFLNHSERARKIQPKVMQWLLLLEMAVLHGRYFLSLENIEYIEYASTEGAKNGIKGLKDNKRCKLYFLFRFSRKQGCEIIETRKNDQL